MKRKNIEVVTTTELRQNLQEMVDQVYYTEKPIVVIRHKKPKAIIAPLPEEDKEIDQMIEAFKKTLEKIPHKRAGKK